MRDHPYHGSPILAGMWGGWNRCNEKYRAMRQQMFEAVNPIGEVRYRICVPLFWLRVNLSS